MSEDPGTKWAGLILSPIGGFVIGIFFLPTGGCAETFDILAGESCPPDKQTNFFGSTMGGFVSKEGAFLVGLFAAGLAALVLRPRRDRGVVSPSDPWSEYSRRRLQNGEDDYLARLTKDELYERAKAADIKGRSTMSKEQLLAALRAHRS